MRYFILVVLAASVICVSGCGGGGPPDGYRVSNGWVTTPSGLQYKDTAVGYGEKAQSGQAVNVSYKAWLESESESNPFAEGTMGLFIGEGSIPGVEEGVVGMRSGGTCEMIVPPALAYGEAGRDGVPPNSTVHFRIEMVGVDTGFVTKDSGLEYAYVKFGDGPKSVDGQSVTVNYKGSLEDGTVFDSSYNEGREPFTFVLGAGNVIEGWDEGLKGVKRGAKLQLVIPPSLGYGDADMGDIPPNSTLYFEVEVLSIS